MDFIGRERELKLLNEQKKKKIASLVVIKGRRRIGKSRLALEFGSSFEKTLIISGIPPEKGLGDEQQRQNFATQMQQQISAPLAESDNWLNLFWALAKETQTGEVLIILDEISWMGSGNAAFLGQLKTAWDLHFKKNPRLILILSGSVSSWIDKNILSSTGFVGRISLRMDLKELPLHHCNTFWRNYKENVSNHDKLQVLAVTGGVPRYLEEINPALPAYEIVRSLCFRSEGLLFNEFDQIFSDLFQRRYSSYKEIARSLGQQSLPLSEICQKTGLKKGGVITDYLNDLSSAGFLSKDTSWKIAEGKANSISHYRLSDNYIRFYLHYIEPVRDQVLHFSGYKPQAWHGIMGLQFENLVLANRSSLLNLLGVRPEDVVFDNPYIQKKNTKQPGCQVDYMVQTCDGQIYVCEIKFQRSPIRSGIIEELQEKISRINAPQFFSFRPVLIHVNGVSESVEDADYFSHIIDFGQLLEI